MSWRARRTVHGIRGLPSLPMTKTRLVRVGGCWRLRAAGPVDPGPVAGSSASPREIDRTGPGSGPAAVVRREWFPAPSFAAGMQRPELAVRRHPRYPGVRFMDRCHCCCSLTVGSAGWTCLGSAPKVKLRHYPGLDVFGSASGDRRGERHGWPGSRSRQLSSAAAARLSGAYAVAVRRPVRRVRCSRARGGGPRAVSRTG